MRTINFGKILVITLCIGGVITAAFLILFAVVFRKKPTDIELDAWMSYAGSLVGAAVTVFAAVSAVQWQRAQDLIARRAFLGEAIDEAIRDATIVVEYVTPSSARSWTHHHFSSDVRNLLASISWLDTIMEESPPIDVYTLRTYSELKKINAQVRDKLQIEMMVLRGLNSLPADFGPAARRVRDKLIAARSLVGVQSQRRRYLRSLFQRLRR